MNSLLRSIHSLRPDADVDRVGQDGRDVSPGAIAHHAFKGLLDNHQILLRKVHLGEDSSDYRSLLPP